MAYETPDVPMLAIHAGNGQLTSALQVIQKGTEQSTSIWIDPGVDLDARGKVDNPFFHIPVNDTYGTLLRGGLLPPVPGVWNPLLFGAPKYISAAWRLLKSSDNY